MQQQAPQPGFYLHQDGGIYRVTGSGLDSHSARPVVIYEHVWPFEELTWVRPVSEWESRFIPISAVEVAQRKEGVRADTQTAITAARTARRLAEPQRSRLQGPYSQN